MSAELITGRVIFPGVIVPRGNVGQVGGLVVVCLNRECTIGTLCKIVDASHIEGMYRVSIALCVEDSCVKYTLVDEDGRCSTDLIKEVLSKFEKLGAKKLRVNSSDGNVVCNAVMGFLMSVFVQIGFVQLEDGQRVLECKPLDDRLKLVSSLLDLCVSGIEINASIRSRNDSQMKEMLIRRQIGELEKLLPNRRDENFYQFLSKRKESCVLSAEADVVFTRELGRLKYIQPHSPEFHGIVTYLETVLSLPWAPTIPVSYDMHLVEKYLNSSHFGLEKIKQRIVEYIAVYKLSGGHPVTTLCFLGGPGLGKTSIASSIAGALGKKFIRISLGGVGDEAELRGHRKTYIGAMPGLIVQSLIKLGVSDGVILLDEIDKLGNNRYRSSAESVLLELLDPSQNTAFRDAYLNFGVDVSKCLFICTCNEISTISKPLMDRLEIIELKPYTVIEKVEIAKRFLCVKNFELHGIPPAVFTDEAIQCIISTYTSEHGVRDLDRKIAKICRHLALAVCRSGLAVRAQNRQQMVGKNDVVSILGQTVASPPIPNTLLPGVALGLAVSQCGGGDVLFVECVAYSSKSATSTCTITGQLGSVMKESVSICQSLLASRGFTQNDGQHIHVHFPCGSISKDGPSAGVSTCIALASLALGKSVSAHLASTGEVTLRGEILPVGGIYEKILAAHTAGIKRVIIPESNRNCAKDVPEYITKQLEILYVRNIDQVLLHALDYDAHKISNISHPHHEITVLSAKY